MPDQPLSRAQAPTVSAIDAELARDGAHGVFLIPSTAATIAAVPRWIERGIPVAASRPGTLRPDALLALLKGDNASAPRTSIVFSDQLLSPVDAPLLIERGGHRQYMPAVELLCHTRHGIPVTAWTGTGFERAAAEWAPDELLRLVVRHHEACDALGSEWLVRGEQAERSASHRLNDARRRLQLFQSVLLHAFSHPHMPPEYEELVRRVAEMRKSLNAAARMA